MTKLKFKIQNAVLVALVFGALGCRAAVTTPFIFWNTDLGGDRIGNTVTIKSWTNDITSVSTNLVSHFEKSFYPTNPIGFMTGVLPPGRYRLTVQGLQRGVLFDMPASAGTQNIAQLTFSPAPINMNWTIAQFSDAGTMAYEQTNTFARVVDIGTIANRSSNDFALVTSLGTIAGLNAVDFSTRNQTTQAVLRILGSNNFYNGSFIGDGQGLTNIQAAGLENATNALAESATLFGNLVGKGNDQTISGNKVHTGSNYFAGNVNFAGEVGSGGPGQVSFSGSVESGNAFVAQGNGFRIMSSTGSFFSVNLQILTGGKTALVGVDHLTGKIALATNAVAFGDLTVKTNLAVEGDAAITGDITAATVTADVVAANATLGVTSTTGGSLRTTSTNSFSHAAFRGHTITLAAGVNQTVVVGTNSNAILELSGPPGSFAITGFYGSPNTDGQLLFIDYNGTENCTLAVESGSTGNDPVAECRIEANNGTTTDRVSTGAFSAILRYNAVRERWKIISWDP